MSNPDRSRIVDKKNISGLSRTGMYRMHKTRRFKKKNPHWRQEPAQLGIRRARVPLRNVPLSGRAILVEEGKHIFTIRFDEVSMVQLLGRLMPQGISYFKPAYIKVVWRELRQMYEVLCCYTDKSASVLLWRTETLPAWVWRAKPI